MKNGAKVTIVIVVLVLLFAGLYIYKSYAGKVKMNDGNVSGNTAGNLYGNGMFCVYGKKVYFANPNDNGALYVMDLNEKNAKKLIADKVYFINTDGNYIYYCRDSYAQESAMSFMKVNQNCLCRCKMDGSDVTILDDALCTNATLAGNTIYYNRSAKGTPTQLYSIKIDGTDKKMVENSTADPRGIFNSKIYFAGVIADHYLKSIENDRIVTTMPTNVWMPLFTSPTALYSLDLDNDLRLCRINMSDGTKKELTPLRVSNYNIHGNYVIYQSFGSDADGLYVFDMGSLTNTLIMPGAYKNICTTDNYYYFTDYNSGVVYHGVYGGGAGVFMP